MITSGKMLAGGLLAIFVTSTVLAGETIVKIDNIRSDRVYVKGFDLLKGGEFLIKGAGVRGPGSDDFIAYGWLLNSRTREPVWVMESGNTDRSGSKGFREADKKIALEKGKYELYYYAAGSWSGKINIGDENVFEFLGDLFSGNLNNDVEDYIDELYIEVRSTDSFKDFVLFDPDGTIEGALLQINKVGDSEYIEKGFTLSRPMEIRIYALCEYPSSYNEPVDHAWIMSAETGKKVWSMDRWNTDPAGGGQKNRSSNEKVKFEKGKYVLYYVTDDSHSFEEFNVTPPYDPLNWGVALIAVDDSDKNAFSTYVPEGRGEPLVDMTRMRDDEFVSQAFQLDSDQSVRVIALGEYSTWSKEFVDYGWIENASTGKMVWEMSYRNTEHAGGATKNRMFDGLVEFPKGYYIAHYTSDDSHSYRDWNESPPYEPALWGLSIYAGKDFNKSRFKLLDESEVKRGAEILVKMTGLHNDERERAEFALDNRTRVRIYAIGEGSREEMYDYGWIVDDNSGKSVWEMTWRNTGPAGGASKNRLYDETVILAPGNYEVYFVTDGSHSFNDWNAAKPRDPVNWGITISKVEELSR